MRTILYRWGLFSVILGAAWIVNLGGTLLDLCHIRRWSNCWWYAITRWQKEGGAVVLTHSRYGWWPHFYYDDGEYYWSLDPPTKHHRWMPPILFQGTVRRQPRQLGH